MYGTVAWPLIRTARLNPEREAVVDGDRRLNYAQLYARVAAMGTGLDRIGIQRGEVVSMLAFNSQEHLEAWLGSAGARPRVQRLEHPPVRGRAGVHGRRLRGRGAGRRRRPSRTRPRAVRAVPVAPPAHPHRRRSGAGGDDRLGGAGQRSRRDLPGPRGRHAGGDRLHGRHVGSPEGGHAQPSQPAVQRQAVHDRDHAPAVGSLSARAADVPRRRHVADVRADLGGRHARDAAELPARRGRPRDRGGAHHAAPARADDDRDAARRSRGAATGPLEPAAALLRRVPDAGRAAAPRDGATGLRVLPAVRDDRGGAAGHAVHDGGPPPRRPRARSPTPAACPPPAPRSSASRRRCATRARASPFRTGRPARSGCAGRT